MTLNTQATSLREATAPLNSSSYLRAALPNALTLVTDIVPNGTGPPIILVADQDENIREIACDLLEREGYVVHSFVSVKAVIQEGHKSRAVCLIADAKQLEMSVVGLVGRLKVIVPGLPIIITANEATATMAVQAMKAGAVDFIEKPFRARQLLDSVEAALEPGEIALQGYVPNTACSIARFGLTNRQSEILELVLNGYPSKNIAADLGISQRTVENHRAAIMKKTGSKSLPELVRVTLAAA